MKKIFRMALVFVLAGATLLYTGCTKDYSPDLNEIQKQVDGLKADLQSALSTLEGVKGDINNLKATDTALQGKIDQLKSDLDGAIADLQDQIKNGDDAVKGYVDEEIAKIKAELDDLADELGGRIDDLEDRVDGLDNSVAELRDIIDNLETAGDTLAGLFQTYASFIQSMAYVPASSDGWIPVLSYMFTDSTYSDPLLVASFKVTPADAVSRLTMDNASVVMVATSPLVRAAAAPEDTLTITKLVYREDAPGYVDVYASYEGEIPDEYYEASIALTVTQEENTLVESVTSDYAQVYFEVTPLWFDFYDNKTGAMAQDYPTYDVPVRVSPTSETDTVCVFTEDRWTVKAMIDGQWLTPAEAKEVLSAETLALVSPLAGDTAVVNTAPKPVYFTVDSLGLGTTVTPKDPNTVVSLLTDDITDNESLRVGLVLKNSHAVPTGDDPDDYYSTPLVGTFLAVPDTVKMAMAPVEEISIPWDYKYWDNIADTTIKKVAVEQPAKLLTPDATLTSNVDTDTDYTENSPSAVVANGDNALDVTISSKAAYGKADSSYVYQILKFQKGNATEYEGNLNYVVEARPADLVVTFDAVDTCVRFTNGTLFDKLAVVPEILKVQGDAYKLDGKYDLEDVAKDLVATLNDGGSAKADSLVVFFNGEKVTPDASYTVWYTVDDSGFRYPLNKVGEYEFHIYDNAYGIKYEFVLPVNVTNNPAKIAPKATFMTEDNAETKDYSVQVKGDYDESFHYYLTRQRLEDYIKVIDYAEDSDSLVLASALATPGAEGISEPKPANNPTALVRLEENKQVANLDKPHTYEWGTYDSLQFKVAATLIPVANKDYVIDSLTIRLWTVDPIPVFQANDGLVALHEKDQYAKVDLLSGIKVQDLNGYDLVGKVGDAYKLLTPDGKTVFNYDQDLKIGKPELVSGAENIEELRLDFDEENPNVLLLKRNQGTIVTPIVVKVPITLTYMLDQGLEDKNTVYVTVTFQEK